MRGRKLSIADTEYDVLAVASYPEKVRSENGYLGIKVALRVQVANTNNVLGWHEMKGTYLAEKLSDYVENCFNGQETFYWDNSKNEGCDSCNNDKIKASMGYEKFKYCPICGKRLSK